jgi:predicted DCC family thiol-disulfide oxidoreductase YuxK
VTERLDAWIHGGAMTRTSLARYRIVYALIVLLMLPDFAWIAVFPDSMYNPPPGPMQLLSGFPSLWVLRGLEAALAVCLVAILLGWRTRTASFLSVAVAMTGYGLCYSLGKIDHDILLVLVPAPMALAGWGDRLSLDAARRRARGEAERPERADQWPLRLYALMIGLAFLTAATYKLRGGWLDPSTHAVQASVIEQYFTHGRGELLVPMFLTVKNPVFWEILDVATVVLEAGLVLAVLTWATTRVWFAIAATFHVGVWLMLNIPFFMNVVAYGFVVPWDRVPVPRGLRDMQPAPRLVTRLVRVAPLVVLGGGIAWAALIDAFARTPTGGDPTRFAAVMYPLVLVAGALIGAGYLVFLSVRLVRSLRDAGDASTGRLIYDSDCGFCTRSAQWLARRRPERVGITPWQAVPDLAALGLDEHDVTARAYWQDSSGTLRPGHEAIAAALVARGGPAVAAGRLIASPFVAPLSADVYRWVATHRHAMPGSTDACRLPVASPSVDG